MKEEECKALFLLAGIPVLKMWELPNRQLAAMKAFLSVRAE